MQLADNQALVEMWKAAGINVKLIMCENWDQVGNIGGIKKCTIFFTPAILILGIEIRGLHASGIT